ncbi:MAG: recombinase family protein [Clostridia bacterium]|nr:recombinase family protein [Clostridia bacterium]
MTNIVIYARYSSAAQTEQSIEGQLRVCHEYAERMGYIVLKEYIDRAMTGTNDNRPAFQQMIEDSNKKEFTYVLVYKLDRFSRSKYDNAIYKHRLEQNGVRVISATESISNTPEGLLMEGLLEMFAEMYSKDLSQKVKRGIRENSLKGLYSGGNMLYGYKAIDKKIYIDEEKAPAVKFIFESYAKGLNKQDIIKNLNLQGYKTNKNKNFSRSSLDKMLSNQKYIGIYKDNYTESTNFYPAIITQDLFNKVQEMLKHKQRYKKHSEEDFVLTGKLFCGHCGSSMIGTSGTSRNGTKHTYYGCMKKLRTHICNKRNEQKEKIEKKVFAIIKNKILTKAKISELATRIVKEYENNINEKTINNLFKQISKIDNKLDSLTEQLIKTKNESMLARINKMADELTNEKQEYEKQISKLKLAIKTPHTKQEIEEYLNIFFEETDSTIYKQRIAKHLINAIYIFDDYIYIHFNIINLQPKISLEKVKDKIKEDGSSTIDNAPPVLSGLS